MVRAEDFARTGRQVVFREEPGADRVGDVVVEVGDRIGQLEDLALQRAGGAPALGHNVALHLRVFEDAFTDFPSEVEPLPAALELLDDTKALLVVAKPFR